MYIHSQCTSTNLCVTKSDIRELKSECKTIFQRDISISQPRITTYTVSLKTSVVMSHKKSNVFSAFLPNEVKTQYLHFR